MIGGRRSPGSSRPATRSGRSPGARRPRRAAGGRAPSRSTVDLFDADAVRAAVVGVDAIAAPRDERPAVPAAAAGQGVGARTTGSAPRGPATSSMRRAAAGVGAHRQGVDHVRLRGRRGRVARRVRRRSSPTPGLMAPALDGRADRARARGDGGDGGRAAVRPLLRRRRTGAPTRCCRSPAGARSMVAGKPGAYMSSLHADDAATAVVAALDAPTGIYNVCDDEPLTRRDALDAFAAAFGTAPAAHEPGWLIRLLAGRGGRRRSSRRSGSSNRKFRDDDRLGADVSEPARGLEGRAREHGRPAMRDDGAANRAGGARAPVADRSGSGPRSRPASFYDDFPGLGRMWVAPDGPYNEHLVRDVGELNLALVVITVVGAGHARRRSSSGRCWRAGSCTRCPHLVYHLRNMAPFATDDQVSIGASLALVPILAVVLLVIEVRCPP